MCVQIISLMKGRQYKLELANFLKIKRNEIFIASIFTSALRPVSVKKEPILTHRTRFGGSFSFFIIRNVYIIIFSYYYSGIYLVCRGLLFISKPCSHVNGIQEQGLGLFTVRLEQISIIVL